MATRPQLFLQDFLQVPGLDGVFFGRAEDGPQVGELVVEAVVLHDAGPAEGPGRKWRAVECSGGRQVGFEGVGAGRGDRTHTPSRVADFKSAASTFPPSRLTDNLSTNWGILHVLRRTPAGQTPIPFTVGGRPAWRIGRPPTPGTPRPWRWWCPCSQAPAFRNGQPTPPLAQRGCGPTRRSWPLPGRRSSW